jgi:DNA-binding GntR family transcriptional regulator
VSGGLDASTSSTCTICSPASCARRPPTCLTLLEGISGRTLAEHEAIFNALSAREAALSQAAALLHVSTTEQWLREHLRSAEPLPVRTTERK